QSASNALVVDPEGIRTIDQQTLGDPVQANPFGTRGIRTRARHSDRLAARGTCHQADQHSKGRGYRENPMSLCLGMGVDHLQPSCDTMWRCLSCAKNLAMARPAI